MVTDIAGFIYMDYCQESGCNHDIITDFTDGNDLGLFLFYKKSTGKNKTSFIAEKSENDDTDEKLSDEIKSGSFLLYKEVMVIGLRGLERFYNWKDCS